MENIKNNPSKGPEQIDDLFRKTLEGQKVEPAKNLWKGINRKLLFREISHFNLTNLPGTLWISGIAGIVLIPVIIYLALTPDKNIPSKPNPETRTVQSSPLHQADKSSEFNGNLSIQQPSNAPSNTVAPITLAGSNQPQSEKSSIKINYPASAPIQQEKKTTVSNHETPLTPSAEKKPARIAKSVSKQKPSVAIADNTAVASLSRSRARFKKEFSENTNENISGQMLPPAIKSSTEVAEKTQLSVSNPAIQTMLSLNSLDSLKKAYLSYPPPLLINLGIFPTSYGEHAVIPQHFSFGLGFMPEMAFYKTTSSYSKVNYWLGADLSYHLWKFYIRPGISIGYMYDEGSYQLNYKRNDSIGFYYQVVSYTIDPHNPGVIIYHTVNHTVYDSVLHNGNDQTRTRYQYVQIPLLFGYDVIELKNFGFSVQAGPVVSFFIADKETPSQNTDLTGARLLSRINSAPPGKNPNWQIWGAIHMEYRFSGNFNFYLEPTYKYYFNPVVGNEVVSVKAPWAIGLGIGFTYNFGFNTLRP